MVRVILNVPSAKARTPPPAPPDFMPVYTRLMFYAGMWPPRSESKRKIYRFYSIFISVLLALNCIGELVGMVFTETLDAFGESLCSGVFRGLAFFEVVSFAIRPTRVQRMFDTLADIVHRPHNALDSAKVQECHKIANRFSLKFLKGMMMYFLFSSAGVAFQPVVTTILIGRAPKPFLASNFWSFGIQVDGFISNGIIYTNQAIAQFLSTLVCVTYECFVVSLTYYGACQTKALRHMLSNLDLQTPDAYSDRSKPPTYEKARSQLVYCIRLHQDLLRFSDELRNLFEEIVLIQFMASLSFIATLLYQAVTVPTNKFFAVAMILICSNTQVLGYCWSSTQLAKETAAVGRAAFSSSWWSAPADIRRMMIPVLLRSHKASSLWCWKLSAVDLRTWITIVQKSYSFYTLMRDRG